MPGLPPSISHPACCFVGLVPDQRSTHSICYLPDEQQNPRGAALEAEHRVQVDQQVGEPHGRAQVVKEVPHRVTEPPAEWQGPLRWPGLLHDQFNACDKPLLFSYTPLSLLYVQIHSAIKYTKTRSAEPEQV